MSLRQTGLFRRCFLTGCLAVGIFLILLAAPVGKAEEQDRQMAIAITLKDPHLEVLVDDAYRLVNQATGEEIAAPAAAYIFSHTGGNIAITDHRGNLVGLYQGPIHLEPVENPAVRAAFTIHNARLGDQYRGSLLIKKAEPTGIKAVNLVDLEAYLRGVVPREMPSAWGNYGGMEALKAQAVASRTYALYHQNHRRHEDYHLCDMYYCQEYGGISCETENTNRAVEETRGEVLLYQGRLIAPYYHATNGGFTELSQNVWSEPLPYIKSRHDPYDDPDNPQGIRDMVIHNYARWQTSLSLAEIENKLLQNPGETIGSIEIVSTFASGRVNELQVRLVGGRTLSFYKQQSRTALGLRSQMFQIREALEDRVWLSGRSTGITIKESVSELEGKWVIQGSGEKRMLLGESFHVQGASRKTQVPLKSYIFEGQGWGHGVGMSQNGAYNRSRDGHEYREILSFYYPGTELSYTP